MNTSEIKADLMVHVQGEGQMGGAKGEHVGTVDHLDGEYIKLKKNDSPTGMHRWIPISLVSHCDERACYLSCTKEEFNQRVLDEDPQVRERRTA